MAGWAKLHRSILDHWLWKDKPFSRGQAWIDLVLLANHQPNKTLLNGELVEVQRGQHITSILKLADRWGWGRKKVSKFLDDLESDGMLTQIRTTQSTTLTIVNYGFYQSEEHHGEQQKNSQGTTEEQPRNTNKNEKNVKNEKKDKDIMSSGTSAEPVTEYPYKEIVDYLNQKANTAFRSTSKDTRKHIKARIDDGYSVDDFKAVIDKKVYEWDYEPVNGEKDMRPYIRPSTLFGTKFEEYLNTHRAERKSKPASFNNFQGRSYSNMDEITRQIIEKG